MNTDATILQTAHIDRARPRATGVSWRWIRAVSMVLGLAVLTAACVTPLPLTPTSTPSFLGPDDFAGQYRPRSRNTTTGGEAAYDGHIVFTNLARSVVEQALPSGFELADNTSTVAELQDQHPILLMFGVQSDTKWVLYGQEFDVGDDYKELILLIPFVTKQGHDYWHNYSVRIYLDDLAALLLGNLYYGYAKQEADFQVVSDVLDVTRLGNDAFHTEVDIPGPRLNDADAAFSFANYDAIKAILDMPVLGQLTHLIGDPPVCSYFEMGYDDVQVAEMTSTHVFLTSFSTGTSSWVALGTLSSVEDGAIAADDLEWRVGKPRVCRF